MSDTYIYTMYHGGRLVKQLVVQYLEGEEKVYKMYKDLVSEFSPTACVKNLGYRTKDVLCVHYKSRGRPIEEIKPLGDHNTLMAMFATTIKGGGLDLFIDHTMEWYLRKKKGVGESKAEEVIVESGSDALSSDEDIEDGPSLGEELFSVWKNMMIDRLPEFEKDAEDRRIAAQVENLEAILAQEKEEDNQEFSDFEVEDESERDAYACHCVNKEQCQKLNQIENLRLGQRVYDGVSKYGVNEPDADDEESSSDIASCDTEFDESDNETEGGDEGIKVSVEVGDVFKNMDGVSKSGPSKVDNGPEIQTVGPTEEPSLDNA